MEQFAWRNDPRILSAACPVCGAALVPDDIWLKKGSNSWYTLAQCPCCAGTDSEAGQGVFQRYKLARRDGLHWTYARCLQMPTPDLLARWAQAAPPAAGTAARRRGPRRCRPKRRAEPRRILTLPPTT